MVHFSYVSLWNLKKLASSMYNPIVLWIETMYIHKKAFYISEKFQTMGKVFLEPSILSLGPSFIAKSFGEMGLIGQGVIVVILILMIVQSISRLSDISLSVKRTILMIPLCIAYEKMF